MKVDGRFRLRPGPKREEANMIPVDVELNIPVILGTVREGRQSENVARYVHARLAARPGTTSPFIDPRDHDFGNLKGRVIDLPDPAKPVAGPPISDDLVTFIKAMHAADGFVIVTPEYNYSFPGALKNLLDATLKPWNRKPFALIGCGGVSGGLRAIDSLRQVVAGVGGVTVPNHVSVQGVSNNFGPAGPTSEADAWNKRLDSLLHDVEWYAKALKAARSTYTSS